MVVELSDADPADGNVADSVPEGVTVRAWYGVKSVRLNCSSPTFPTDSSF